MNTDVYEIYKGLPSLVHRLCVIYNAGICGSTLEGVQSDIDLIIPFDYWRQCSMYLREYLKTPINTTSLGGWRFKDGVSLRDIDIWPMSLDSIYTEQVKAIYYPKYRKLITIEVK